jgi:hypothetical protein
MQNLIKFLLMVILLAGSAAAQFEKTDVWVPETAASDSFKTPGKNYYLAGIRFTEPYFDGMGPLMFMVTDNPKDGFDTLKYDDAGLTEVYSIELPDTTTAVISVDFRRVSPWEWYKLLFSDAPADSIRVRLIWREFK